MIELYLSKNNNHSSEAYGKYYPRVSYKETLDIHLMAKHMAEHNTPFSEGTIEGILRDFVKCTREQTLMGNTVKVDDLAIFKVSVIGNGCAKLYDKDSGQDHLGFARIAVQPEDAPERSDWSCSRIAEAACSGYG